MAIIRCPECGREISNMAKACPNCGCPINVNPYDNLVRIKMSIMKGTVVFNNSQKVDLIIGGNIIWQGTAGQIVDLKIDRPTEVTIKYHTTAAYLGGSCTGVIDPMRSKKYNVTTFQGLFFKTKLVLQPVDVFDSD